jgi:hypothetical protein
VTVNGRPTTDQKLEMMNLCHKMRAQGATEDEIDDALHEYVRKNVPPRSWTKWKFLDGDRTRQAN